MVELSRRDFLKTAGALGIALLVPGNSGMATHAQEVPFPWTRGEILFGPDSGFPQTRKGVPVSVWADPSLVKLNLEDAIYPWNNMAAILGRGNLLKVTLDEKDAQIKFIPGSRTKTVSFPAYTQPFSGCLVYSVSYMSTKMGKHELGHALLGLVDFLGRSVYTEEYVNPARCNNPDKPYSGVMASCDISKEERWFGSDDQRLLIMTLLI